MLNIIGKNLNIEVLGGLPFHKNFVLVLISFPAPTKCIMQNGWCGIYTLCVVIMVTVSTKLNNITIAMLTHRPSSFSLPRWRQECKANVISVIASASFFWINWFWAKGLPNCFRSIVYCRAISTQAYEVKVYIRYLTVLMWIAIALKTGQTQRPEVLMQNFFIIPLRHL